MRLSKPVAAFFCAATILALIVEIVFVGATVPLVLHAILAALGITAVVMAWRPISRR